MSKAENTIAAGQRTSIFYALIVVIGTIFMGRLFYLQVVKHDYYREQAAAEQRRSYEIAANRGAIYALDGQEHTPLALNEIQPTVFADQRYIEEPEDSASELQKILGGKKSDIKSKLEGEDVYVVIEHRISREQAEKIRELELPGIGLNDVPYRVYPEGSLASQLMGFVNNDGEGQYGVEQALDDRLSGTDGILEAITDINNVPLTTNEDNIIKPSEDGDNVVLTIDVNIQRFVEEALRKGVKSSGGKSGSAVVMDPHTGAVLAMANYPTYNPEEIDKIKDYSVLQNGVVSNSYETGSGMKVFTMSTGLNEGVVTKDATYYDSGSVSVDDRVIENADGGHGTQSMLQVIQNSVNTGAVHVLKQLGGGSINDQARNKLYDYFTNRFGFSSATGIAQANEDAGFIISPDEQEGNNVRYANMTFGQGFRVTMLQMVAGLSAVVNGGDYYQPHIQAGVIDESGEFQSNDPQVIREDIISNQVSEDLKEMMQAVVQNGGGFSAKREGYKIGGKTGTSQVIDEDTGLYSEFRENGSFMGWGASSRVDYVIMTRVNEPTIGGYAGTAAAAPIFSDISNFLIDYYQIPPNQ